MTITSVLLLAAVLSGAPDEAALRRTFSKEVRSRTPEKRVEAVRKLAACKESQTIALLVKVLRDREAEVRKAAAEVLATAEDGEGKALKPLAAVLINLKEDPGVRFACAQALEKSPYKAEAIGALVTTISGIDKTQRHLFKFGADCTVILNGLGGQDFGAGKDTPKKWQDWWKANRTAIVKADAEKLKEYKKAARKR